MGNFLSDAFEDVTGIKAPDIAGGIEDAWNGITGQTAADAVLEGAEIQAEAGQQAILAQQAALDQQRQDLQPFTDFGLGYIPQFNNSVSQSQHLFSPTALDSVLGSETLAQLNNPIQERLLRIQAGGGRTRTDETAQALQSNRLNLAQGVLSNERNAALANRSSLLQALGIGQNSAAGQGAASINTAANVGNTLTSIGAAEAAGVVGAANAQQQGLQNVFSLGVGALTGGFNPFASKPGTQTFGPNQYGGGFYGA